MANSIASLSIDLVANTARFIAGMQKASTTVRNFQVIANKAFKRFTAVFKGAIKSLFSFKGAIAGLITGGGLLVLTNRTLDNIDAIGKMSKTYGIATKELGTFQLAASLGGSSLQTFAKAARQISKNVFDFVVRGTGEAADAFRQLGITAQTLKPIMNDQVGLIGLIGDRLNGLKDGAIKTALAYKLLGGRAIELLPALAGGSRQLEKYRQEAEELGLAMSTSTVKGVERANDAITRLKFLFTGFIQQTIGALAPAIEQGVTAFKNFILEQARASGGIKAFALEAAIAIAQGFNKAVDSVELFIKALDKGKELLIAIGVIDNTTQQQQIAKYTSLLERSNESLRRYRALGAETSTLYKIADKNRELALNKLNELQGNNLSLLDKTKVGIQDIIDKLEKQLALQRQAGEFVGPPAPPGFGAGGGTGGGEIFGPPAPAGFGGPDLISSQATADAIASAYDSLQSKLLNSQQVLANTFIEDMQTINDFYTEQLRGLEEGSAARLALEAQQKQDLLALEKDYRDKAGKLAQDQIDATKRAEQEALDARLSGLRTAGSILSSLGSLIGRSSKRSFEINKLLQRAVVIASTAGAIMRAYATGGPPAAAAAALAGAAQLAAVNRSQFGGGGGISSNIPTSAPGGAERPPLPTAQLDTTTGRVINLNVSVNGSVVGTEDFQGLIADTLRGLDRDDQIQVLISGERAEIV